MSRAGRVLFIDGRAGAAGDMLLGALIDAGAPLARIREVLKTLPVDGWTLRSSRVMRCGIAGRRIDVRVRGEQSARGWSSLQRIVRAAQMPDGARRNALDAFRRLIEAEARVHGVPPDKVHLHEAGGVDAILDVVGVCVALEWLDVDRVVASTVTTGFGEVACDHGIYPVPAPATLELMRGLPIRSGQIEVERLTPTGAALLSALVDVWADLPPMRPLAVGYGAGRRDLEMTPNALRVVIGETARRIDRTDADAAPEILVVECTVDDATPQALAYAAERLIEAGARDVFTTAVTMKKGRVGHNLTVLCRPDHLDVVTALLLEETTTLGVRYRTERRVELERELRRVTTRFGPVPVKLGRLGSRIVQAWPEFEDCVRLARRHGVRLAEVQEEALAAARKKTKKKKKKTTKKTDRKR